MKTLTEREWVKVVGHKEVPGRPALYATTSTFLDYFSLSSLSELPTSDAFDEMAKSIDSTSSLKVLNEAPSEVTDRATENKQIKSDTND